MKTGKNTAKTQEQYSENGSAIQKKLLWLLKMSVRLYVIWLQPCIYWVWEDFFSSVKWDIEPVSLRNAFGTGFF